MAPKKLSRVVLLQELLEEQAEDDGLWAEPETAMEEYLQKALRKLHRALDGEEG